MRDGGTERVDKFFGSKLFQGEAREERLEKKQILHSPPAGIATGEMMAAPWETHPRVTGRSKFLKQRQLTITTSTFFGAARP